MRIYIIRNANNQIKVKITHIQLELIIIKTTTLKYSNLFILVQSYI